MITIGVISDTHGLLRPEAIAALAGSEAIIHAGDVGSGEILERLGSIAPVTAVRGNIDTQPWANALPLLATLEIGGVRIGVIHELATPAAPPDLSQFRVMISGHSHKPRIEERDGVLYLNPGSAGPRRFRLPVTVARLRVRGGQPQAELVQLLPYRAAAVRS
ncbi:MAG TPA: metallophosphoesterase family protein [Bryobacteraceae bacterium]|nr:metallophosphoesterase family protein [Bryobacteraceae bacterium]